MWRSDNGGRLRVALGICVSLALVAEPAFLAAHHTGSANEIPTPAGVVSSPKNNAYNIRTTKEAKPRTTARIAGVIAGIAAFCARAPRETYQVDCIGEQLEEVAASMASSGEYADAQQVIAGAARDIRALARANKAPGVRKRRVRGRLNKRRVETKPLIAVRKQSVPAVKEQAAVILEQAETRLLRSAGGSERRQVAYAEMAQAIGSNKTLLRSA